MINIKISIIGTTTFPCPPVGYGGEVVIFDLVESLHKLGHDVILHAVRNNNVDYKFQLNELRDTRINADWNAEYEAYQFYKKDILDSDVVIDMSHGKLIAQTLKTKNIKKEVCNYLIGNFWARPYPPYNIIVNSEKQLQLGINGLTGFEGTPFAKDHMNSGNIPSTSKYIHLGVNTDFYEFQEEKQDYFIWMGRFHPWKGPDIAIQLAKDTGINLILAGGFSNSPDHQFWGHEYLKQIEGCSNIKHIPLPDDERHQLIKRDLVKNAKGFLNPIRFHESFGLVNIEALSCGTPVISMNMGALPEIIKHGETGFLCNNYEQMKIYVNEIDEINPKKCREDIEKRFSREVMAKNYIKILEKLKNGENW